MTAYGYPRKDISCKKSKDRMSRGGEGKMGMPQVLVSFSISAMSLKLRSLKLRFWTAPLECFR